MPDLQFRATLLQTHRIIRCVGVSGVAIMPFRRGQAQLAKLCGTSLPGTV
jgi:hypothetical protein